MNSFGNEFRLSIFGESHGEGIGITIDGVRAGIKLDEQLFVHDLERRRAKGGATTNRLEGDIPHFLSGLYNGHTTGAPLTIWFENKDSRSRDYESLKGHYRPSHADFVASRKYNSYNDPRGGGHFSGRMTVALVAAGVVAKQMLPGAVFNTSIKSIGGCSDPSKFDSIIEQARQDGDSVGGVVECRITGVTLGLGEPLFDSLEGVAAHLLFAIPGIKGVEFGSGFRAAGMRGSEHNDPITDSEGHTSKNDSGGVVGGISNGEKIVVRVAFKPTPSIALTQSTFNEATGKMEPLSIGGRHDSCIALRGAVVVEAAMAIVLADLNLRKRA